MLHPPKPPVNPVPVKMTILNVSEDPIPDKQLIAIYRWLDKLEFTRKKRVSPHRDFADGVMMADLISQFFPKIISLHNYPSASGSTKKRSNWEHLNAQVFKKMRFQLTPEFIEQIADAKPGMIERVLLHLRTVLSLRTFAVMKPSSRLNHVKSRFMDFQRHLNVRDGGSQLEYSQAPLGIEHDEFIEELLETNSNPNILSNHPHVEDVPSGCKHRPQSALPMNESDIVNNNLSNDDVYDEIYCNNSCRETGSDHSDEVSTRRPKKVWTYEYKEEYTLNGIPIGSTAYPAPPPDSSKKAFGVKERSRSQSRSRGSRCSKD